jgi:shikimate dehydrogenase
MYRFGLIGKNIQYSQSPNIFLNFQTDYDIPLTYELFDVNESNIVDVIDQLRSGHLNGLNVTKPYKETLLKYCDQLSESAHLIGAVNTLYLKENQLIGHNTDYDGFIKMIDYHQINLKDEIVYVLGNGGAAKAVYYALIHLGAKPVIVKRASSLKQDFTKSTITYEEALKKQVSFVVQTTTSGLRPSDPLLLPIEYLKKVTFIDLIYEPSVTFMMSHAKMAYNGSVMLLEQARASFLIWTHLSE